MHRQKTLEYSYGQRCELVEERILLVVSTTTSYAPYSLTFLIHSSMLSISLFTDGDFEFKGSISISLREV